MDFEPKQRAIAPQRLGGKPVLSLEGVPESAIVPAESRLDVDMNNLADAAGFSVEERLFLQMNKLEGTPRRQFEGILGWDAATVARVQRSVERKLHLVSPGKIAVEVRRDSLSMSRREKLRSGHRVWALAPMDDVFVEIMLSERLRPVEKNISQSCLKPPDLEQER